MTLALANTNQIDQIISQANLANTTKYQYRKAIKNAVAAGINLADPNELATYAQSLGKSSKSFLKAAIKLWSRGIELAAKGQATPDNVSAVLATTYRLEALNEAIKVEARTGTKAHLWLSQAEVKKLFATCDAQTTMGQRDRIVLGLVVGAGLRREELGRLTFDTIKAQGNRIVIEVMGKGAKSRVVPISKNLAHAIDEWLAIVGPGRIARSIRKGGKVGASLSVIGIFHIVTKAGQAIGKPELAPHDLRRTYAQIGYDAGVPITQISKLLGHSSVATTQKYLNLDLDLKTTISDFIPFE